MNTTTSDPGTSAILTPFCKTDGLYFDGSNEPEDFKYNFDRDVENYYVDNDCLNVLPSFDSIKDYYDFHLNNTEISKQLTKEIHDRVDMYTIEINLDEEDIE